MSHLIQARDPFYLTHPAVTLFLFSVLVLLVRLFLRGPMLELDEAEQVVMAQHFSPGYPDQPPLYTWLQFGFFRLLGLHITSIALLKSLLLFGCLYYFHQICRLHCQSLRLAWCATLSWVFIPAISFDLIKDNTHSILALFLASLTWYWFIIAPRISQRVWYLVLGCILGAGILSKFNYLLFIAILFVSALSVENYRYRILNKAMLITLVIATVIASPYFFWLSQHTSLAFRAYKLVTVDKQQWHGLVNFIKALLAFAAPCFIISRIFFPFAKRSQPIKTRNSTFFWFAHVFPYLSDDSRANGSALLIRYHLVCLPFLLLAIFITGIKNIETRWLIPILFLCPVRYFSHLKYTAPLHKRVIAFLSLCLILQSIFFGALIYRSHSDKRHEHVLLRKIATAIKNEHYPLPPTIISDSPKLLGNLMLQLSIPSSLLLHPAIGVELPAGNSLLIWQSRTPPFWVYYFVNTELLGDIKTIENNKNLSTTASYAYVVHTP